MIEVDIKTAISKFEKDINYKFIFSICKKTENSEQVSSAHQRILAVATGGDEKKKRANNRELIKTLFRMSNSDCRRRRWVGIKRAFG